jgi:hypothetical protein
MTQNDSTLEIKAVPASFSSHNSPQLKTDRESTIEMVAGSKTDLFFDPDSGSRVDTAPKW